LRHPTGSVGTARNYPTTIVTKLKARNRADAIKAADDVGWLPLRRWDNR
jgi:DNA-binding NarL/FixJ family response regulator